MPAEVSVDAAWIGVVVEPATGDAPLTVFLDHARPTAGGHEHFRR
jgi:hypothetical protein